MNATLFRIKPYLIRHRIQSQGLKLWWVAEYAGVHKTTLRRWLSGQIAYVQEDHLRSLARVLEMDWQEIGIPLP